VTHARALDKKKHDAEKIANYAVADWARKSNSSRAAASNITPLLVRPWDLSARASTTTISTTVAFPTERIIAVETNSAPWPTTYN
jgi:hypothetical protein